MTDRIAVLDFGSQYSHLICRRIREMNVCADLVRYDAPASEVASPGTRGIVLSGGPASVYEEGAPSPDGGVFEAGLPVLGICYGHQLIVDRYGGTVRRAKKEYGSSILSVDDGSDLLSGIGGSVRAWMSHGDAAERAPDGFRTIGHTDGADSAAIAMSGSPVYGIQFHPEVAHTEQGSKILSNFVLGICGAAKDWTMEGFVRDSQKKLASVEGRVLCGVSGGVDSTVAAVLLHRAVGDRLRCVFVDNGLLREGEAVEVRAMFADMGIEVESVDAGGRFLSRLEGVSDPEQKRKIVGDEFARVFVERAQASGPFAWLAQGTLYPDVIESGVSGGPADVIKSHHNVGGLPEQLGLGVLEPLRELYKDEVRQIGRILGLPERALTRHPFPGPGLAVRVIGEVTPEKLRICRTASRIVEEELRSSGSYERVWQAYATVGDDKAVGVVGDRRRYGNVVMVRSVDSDDAMTADWTRLSHGELEKISNRITNEIEDVTWVSYAVSSKPPSTIEPQ